MKNNFFQLLYVALHYLMAKVLILAKRVLMTVISREELASMKLTISEIDPHAFVNITETVEVLGLFRKG